jgi:hypothetical protein
MIEIRSCCGVRRNGSLRSSSRSRPGATTKAMSFRAKPSACSKIGGQVLGAFDSELAAGQPGGRPKRWWVSPCLCRESSNPKRSAALTSIRTCWRFAHRTAIAALARNSNGNNGVRRFPAASGTWSGPSIRSKSRMLSSISTGWARSPASIVWISMVYPHLDCRVGSQPTGFWRSGSWIPRELRQLLLSARQQRTHRRTHSGSGFHRPWKASEATRERALDVQLENRRKFQQAFSRGLVVLGFSRDAEGNGVFELGSLTQLQSNHGSVFLRNEERMRIDAIILRELHMPLVRPFETSFGVTRNRRIVLAEVQSEGLTGWGECTAGERPFFSGESTDSAWQVMVKELGPMLAADPGAWWRVPRASFALCAAIPWPKPLLKTPSGIWRRSAKASLSRLLGGVRDSISAASPRHSVLDSRAALDHRARVGRRLSAHQAQVQARLGCGGFRAGAQPLARHSAQLRRQLRLPLRDEDHLESFDAFDLLMIEQPLWHDDFYFHSVLQSASTRPSASTNPSATAAMRWRPSRWSRARSSTSSWAAWAASPRPSPCTTRRWSAAFPSGAAECSSPASAARTTSRFPRSKDSRCPATSPPRRVIGRRHHRARSHGFGGGRDCDSRYAWPRLRGANRPDRKLTVRKETIREMALVAVLAVAEKSAQHTPNEQKIGDYYATCMDEKAIDDAGLKPFQAEFDRISAVTDKKQLTDLLAHDQMINVNALFQLFRTAGFRGCDQTDCCRRPGRSRPAGTRLLLPHRRRR